MRIQIKEAVVGNIDQWATYIGRKEVIDYRGMKQLGTTWYGGNFFVKSSELFKGLPHNCVLKPDLKVMERMQR